MSETHAIAVQKVVWPKKLGRIAVKFLGCRWCATPTDSAVFGVIRVCFEQATPCTGRVTTQTNKMKSLTSLSLLLFALLLATAEGNTYLRSPPRPGAGGRTRGSGGTGSTPAVMNCPGPAEDAMCIGVYSPMECGPDNCWYSNPCFAQLAQWNIHDGQVCQLKPGPPPDS